MRRFVLARCGYRVDNDGCLLALKLVHGSDSPPGTRVPISETCALYGATIECGRET